VYNVLDKFSTQMGQLCKFLISQNLIFQLFLQHLGTRHQYTLPLYSAQH